MGKIVSVYTKEKFQVQEYLDILRCLCILVSDKLSTYLYSSSSLIKMINLHTDFEIINIRIRRKILTRMGLKFRKVRILDSPVT